MKILFLNSVYQEKSTGILLSEIEKAAKRDGHETLTIYGRGAKKETGIKIQGNFTFLIHVLFSRINGKIWDGFGRSQTKKIIRIIERFRPDVINLHQLYGFYLNPEMLMSYINKKRIPVVITLHDFTLLTGKCGSPVSCNNYLKGCGNCPRLREYPTSYFFDRTHMEFLLKEKSFSDSERLVFVPVSKWLEIQAKNSMITKNCAVVQIDNGLDTDLFRYRQIEDRNRKFVAVVSANFKDINKGYPLLIETIRYVKSMQPEIRFVLMGKHSDYILKRIESKEGVLSLGVCDGATMNHWYQNSFCAFLTSESETFSMTTAEALCAGVPVVGPQGCGAPEYLFPHRLSQFSCPRDPEKLGQAIMNLYDDMPNENELRLLSEEARRKFNKSEMTRRYLHLFKEVAN